MRGNGFQLLSEVTDHGVDGSQTKQQDNFVTTQAGTKKRRENTKG